MKNKLLSIIIITMIAFGTIAYAIYIYNNPQEIVIENNTQPTTEPLTQAEKEKKVLESIPNQNASKEEIEMHSQMIKDIAIETSNIKIEEGCKLNPLVAKIKKGSDIKFLNNSENPVGIIIQNEIYEITPGIETSIKIPSIVGILGYSCGPERNIGKIGWIVSTY